MTRTTPLRTVVATLLLGIVAWGCSDDPQAGAGADPLARGPEAGTLAVVLTSSPQQVGAVSFLLDGADVRGLRPGQAGITIFTAPEGTGWRVAAAGERLSGELVRFEVGDVGTALSDLRVRLTEAADLRNQTLARLEGLTAEVQVVR